MAEEHGPAAAQHAEEHGPTFKEKIFPWFHNFLGRRAESAGFQYSRRISLTKGRAISQVGQELKKELIFQVNKRKTDELWKIEQDWKDVDGPKEDPGLRQQIENLYSQMSHYTTEEKIEDEIELAEYGTNVKLPVQQANEFIEYVPLTPANKQLKDDKGNVVKIRDKPVQNLRQLVELLEDPSLNLAQKHAKFDQLKDMIKKWIDEDSDLKKLNNKFRDKIKYDDVEKFLKSLKYTDVNKYSNLEIKPVTRVHFNGGRMIGPKKAINKLEVEARGRKLEFSEISQVYSAAKKAPKAFQAFFLDNNENKMQLADWVAKEIGLKHLARQISEIKNTQEFIDLFPKDKPNDYKEPEFLEELCFFGFYNYGRITSVLPKIEAAFKSIGTDTKSPLTNVELSTITIAMKKFEGLFKEIHTAEKDFKGLITGFKRDAQSANEKWNKLKTDLSPKNLHFKHTYDITRRFNMPKQVKVEVWSVKEKVKMYSIIEVMEVKKRDGTTGTEEIQVRRDVTEEVFRELDKKIKDSVIERYDEIENTYTKEEYEKLDESKKSNIIKAEKKKVKQYSGIQFFENSHPKADIPAGKRLKDLKEEEWVQGFQRPEELEAGLDYRGMPLEVYPKDGKYYVLIDHWFSKMAQNSWQMMKIASKFTEKEFRKLFEGRADFHGRLKTKGSKDEKDFSFSIAPIYNPHGRIALGREVKAGFYQRLEILDVVNHLSTNWEAYRDDFRDGRFHKYSRTYIDYVMAAHRFDPIKKEWRGKLKGFLALNTTIIPKIPITTTMTDWKPDPWKRVPVDRSRLPEDEQMVSQEFVLEYLDRTRTVVKELYDNEGNKYKRAPTHMNPAYDRAALAMAETDQEGGGQESGEHSEESHETHSTSAESSTFDPDNSNFGKEWVHWGRMYYYEDASGINKYSENPDPTIGTRGIAKYLIDRVLRQAFTFEEAREILKGGAKGPRYDFGVRPQGVEMPTDPLGGAAGLLKYKGGG